MPRINKDPMQPPERGMPEFVYRVFVRDQPSEPLTEFFSPLASWHDLEALKTAVRLRETYRVQVVLIPPYHGDRIFLSNKAHRRLDEIRKRNPAFQFPVHPRPPFGKLAEIQKHAINPRGMYVCPSVDGDCLYAPFKSRAFNGAANWQCPQCGETGIPISCKYFVQTVYEHEANGKPYRSYNTFETWDHLMRWVLEIGVKYPAHYTYRLFETRTRKEIGVILRNSQALELHSNRVTFSA